MSKVSITNQLERQISIMRFALYKPDGLKLVGDLKLAQVLALKEYMPNLMAKFECFKYRGMPRKP